MDTEIGCKIKELRIKSGISQKELCGDFMDRTILSRIENCRMPPSIEQLKYIAERLNLPVNYFFSKEELDIYENEHYLYNVNKIKKAYDEGYYCDVVNSLPHGGMEAYDILIYYYAGMAYYKLKNYRDSQRILKKFIFKYEQSIEEIQSKYIIEFASALDILFIIVIKSSSLRKGKNYLLLARKYLIKYKKICSLISFKIHSNLGYICCELNEYKEAITLLNSFLQSINNMAYIDILPSIHLSLNIAYYNTEQYDKSIEHIKKSIFFYSYSGDELKSLSCYLNFINGLRYSKNFDKAFEVLNEIKEKCRNNSNLYNRFLVQEAILYFNLGNYKDILRVLKEIDRSVLKKESKMNINFIKGHIEFINKNFNAALRYLSECEKYFLSQNFSKDLSLIYKDLYEITKDRTFHDKESIYKNLKGRRNILI